MTVAPGKGSDYFYLDAANRVQSGTWIFSLMQKEMLAIGNIFATQDDAEAAHTARTAAYRKALGV
jgi:hypothetical protein